MMLDTPLSLKRRSPDDNAENQDIQTHKRRSSRPQSRGSSTSSVGRRVPEAQRVLGNKIEENGIIEEIVCENFMCHSFLKVPLGPNINFIIGHNGSGKSAVLSALTICLGAKANATSRASNLKSFIKEGTEACVVSVKIKNQGLGAFEPATYGESIIVERAFNRSGASGFKLKSARGRVISTAKRDLDELTDHFALQMDNPIAVLSQDQARQFLTSSLPQDKYKFFLKGTQLQQLDYDYSLIEESADSMRATFPAKVENIDLLKEQVARAKQQVELSERQDKIRERLHALSRQMAWAQVEEQEACLKDAEAHSVNCDTRIEATNVRVTKATEKFERAEAEKGQYDTALAKAQEQLHDLEQRKNELSADYQAVHKEVLEMQIEERRIKSELRIAAERCKSKDADVRAEVEKLQAISGGSLARKTAELLEAKSRIEELEQQCRQHDEGLPILRDKETSLNQSIEALKMDCSAKLTEVTTTEQRLRQLQESSLPNNDPYPTGMRRFLSRVGQEHFKTKPKGPLGTHIRLLKSQFSSIIEKALGNMLNGFLVSCKEDQAKLSTMMKDDNLHFPIFLSSGSRLAIESQEPDAQYLTILRALQFDDPQVERHLIITHAIEQIILVEGRQNAVELMSAGRIRNVKACYAQQKNQSGVSTMLRWGTDGGVASTFVDVYRGPPRIRTDVEDQKRLLNSTLTDLRAQKLELDRKSQGLQMEISKNRSMIKNHEKHSRDKQLKLQASQARAEQISDDIEGDRLREGSLDALQIALKDAKAEQQHFETQYSEFIILMDNQKTAALSHQQAMDIAETARQEAERHVNDARSSTVKAATSRDAALREKNKVHDDLEGAKGAKIQAEEKVLYFQNIVDNFQREASAICTRVAVDAGETCMSLEAKLAKLTADLESAAKSMGGTRETLVREHAKREKMLQESFLSLKKEEELATKFSSIAMKRKERWRYFRQSITSRARTTFMYMLAERAFRGNLRIDHTSQTMELLIQPDETQGRKGARATKTLSGGEKSFSTVCLLLSLWEAIGMPIRCLDEFDVFMDSVNRDISMNMMIQAARKATGRQFILITPQSMTNVDRSEDVCIIKMSDPERGQRTMTVSGSLNN